MHMGYLKVVEWEVNPEGTPSIIRNCSKCGGKSEYINTGNFRVNANGNSIDVWLIYQCQKCKTTYNLSIHERMKPDKILPEEYQKYLSNNQKSAQECGFDSRIFKKNRVEVDYDNVTCQIKKRELNKTSNKNEEQEIIIRCEYELPIRIDKLISQELGISRSKVKQFIKDGFIYSHKEKNLSKSTILDGMEFVLENEVFNMECDFDYKETNQKVNEG
jgi:hypothetical protein